MNVGNGIDVQSFFDDTILHTKPVQNAKLNPPSRYDNDFQSQTNIGPKEDVFPPENRG